VDRFLVAALVLVAASACTPSEHSSGNETGKEIYFLHCSSCHQPDGRGYDHVYPPLAGNPIVRLANPEVAIDVVLRGRGSMPSFGEELTPREIAEVVTFIRRQWGNDASAVTPGQAG